jgi:hypothetical protein
MFVQFTAPLDSNPEPTPLQKRETLPSHVGWLGVHTPSLQLELAWSQYSPASQVSFSVDPSPSAAHSCTPPLQKVDPGSQVWSSQEPFTQVCVDEHVVPPDT